MASELKPRPPALPATTDEFLAHRQLKVKRSLNDRVEDLHLELYEHDGYAKLLDAVYNQHAVEGLVVADRLRASEMIRARADKKGDSEVGGAKLGSIMKSLNVVLRRYGFGREDRLKAITIGEPAPTTVLPEDHDPREVFK